MIRRQLLYQWIEAIAQHMPPLSEPQAGAGISRPSAEGLVPNENDPFMGLP